MPTVIGVVEFGLFGGREIPVADNVEVGRDRVEDGTPLPLEIEPGGRPDFPVAAQQPFALEQRQPQQPSKIFGVHPQQGRVVEHLGRDEGDADRPRPIEAQIRILRARQILHQFLGPIGPDQLFRDADVITQHPGPLGDRQSGLWINPPPQEIGHPAVGVRVAGGADIGSHATSRAIAADHVKKLMRREMRQFVETQKRDLGPPRVEIILVRCVQTVSTPSLPRVDARQFPTDLSKWRQEGEGRTVLRSQSISTDVC